MITNSHEITILLIWKNPVNLFKNYFILFTVWIIHYSSVSPNSSSVLNATTFLPSTPYPAFSTLNIGNENGSLPSRNLFLQTRRTSTLVLTSSPAAQIHYEYFQALRHHDKTTRLSYQFYYSCSPTLATSYLNNPTGLQTWYSSKSNLPSCVSFISRTASILFWTKLENVTKKQKN